MPADQFGRNLLRENRKSMGLMGAYKELQGEFDRWAKDGRAQGLESDHGWVTKKVLSLMELKPGERVLDLSCGSGWVTRLLAQRVTQELQPGQVVGVDISGEMVSLAREFSREFSNIEYIQAPAESIPLQANYFDKILSVEAFYYYPDQNRALDEMYRVLAPGGRLFILINIYRENPAWKYWESHLQVNAHLRSAAEYVQLLHAHNLLEVSATQIRNQWQPQGGYAGVAKRVFELFLAPPQAWAARISKKISGAKRAYDWRTAGSLLLTATKPGPSLV